MVICDQIDALFCQLNQNTLLCLKLLNNLMYKIDDMHYLEITVWF